MVKFNVDPTVDGVLSYSKATPNQSLVSGHPPAWYFENQFMWTIMIFILKDDVNDVLIYMILSISISEASSLPAAHGDRTLTALWDISSSFCIYKFYCWTACVLEQLCVWSDRLLTVLFALEICWACDGLSTSCLNSISHSRTVLITRPPTCTWDNWCDQKLIIDLEWPNWSWYQRNVILHSYKGHFPHTVYFGSQKMVQLPQFFL